VNPGYAYVVDGSVIELFTESKRREREELLRIFQALADNPFEQGDYRPRTAAGREIQVKRFGPWLVTYWSDHPTSEVRVVEVQKLLR
jgi:hypothetical protein